MAKLFAITTRGLESICAQEISALPGALVQEVAYRRVRFTYSGLLSRLQLIRTADDLFVELAYGQEVHKQRSGLKQIRQLAAEIHPQNAIHLIRKVREIPNIPTFSVTASFVGSRNYTTPEIKQAIAEGVAPSTGWQYTSDEYASDLNLRILIDHNQALLGIRLGQKSLQKRDYKQSHIPGSLKPPVAAAMLYLAQPPPNAPIIDPFCGAGTILIEAWRMGYKPIGGDLEPAALYAVLSNAASLSAKISLSRWDALHLPFASNSIATLVTNIPWGRQIQTPFDPEMFYRLFSQELERVLKPNGKAVILTNHPNDLQPQSLLLAQAIEISLFGQTPTILVFSKEQKFSSRVK